jgi:hypothetical protein
MHTNISPKRRPRLLFIVNTAHFFISHRLPLAAAALRAGFDVHVAAEPAIAKRTLAWLIKRALNHKNSRVIFQNNSDLDEFVEEGLCSQESAVLIPGSGVDVGTEYHRRMTPRAPEWRCV